MPVAAGTRLGPYEVLSRIGAGGMGEVYKARDTRLDRIVAVKVSATRFSERLEREARAIAALNHRHVCALYDVGPDYLVMEYVEGCEIEGPLPLDTALKYAVQICEALDAAHRKGITHRDLKPGNILLTRSGVKVLDFGLARMERTGLAETSAESPTEAITRESVIVGTLQYMAPEQLQGQPADARSDIFSFGCVLYELITGKRAFDSGSTASVIAAILERPAPTLAGIAPGSLDWVLRLCLAKEPDDRWQSISDVRAALERVSESGHEPSPARRPRGSRLPWIAAGGFALAAIIASALYLGSRTASAPELRLDIATPPSVAPASFALSPDGRRIAYVATADGVSRLWVRALNEVTARAVPDTEDARHPFWSPDGASIGFLAGTDLKHIQLAGGRPQTITAPLPPLVSEASWGAGNTIVYTDRSYRLMRAAVAGTQTSRLGELPGEMVCRAPRFLAGSRQILFLEDGVNAGIWLKSLTGAPPRRITGITPETDSAAEFLDPGWLIRVRQGNLIAQRFDSSNGALGEPITLASGVGVDPDSGAGAFSVSASRAIAWRSGPGARRQLMWFDRSGKKLGVLGDSDPLAYNPEIAPDGRRVALTRRRISMADIWIQEGSHRLRFTTDPADDSIAIWSPDGKEVVFASARRGNRELYRKPANALTPEQLLLESDFAFPNSWSPDGRYIMYWTTRNNGDLMVLPLGGGKPYPFLSTPFDEETAAFSPDGKWVAYDSNESGRFEVYVRPFPGPGPAWQVSTGGGHSPRWRADGRELYFVDSNSMMMAAAVTAHDATFETGTPQALFPSHIIFFPPRQQYDVSRDGRFLIATETEDASAEPIHILLNWKPPRE